MKHEKALDQFIENGPLEDLSLKKRVTWFAVPVDNIEKASQPA